jgi:hypothetical protein
MGGHTERRGVPYITAGSRSVGYTVNKPFEMESEHVDFSMAKLYYFLFISKCFLLFCAYWTCPREWGK